MGGDPFFLEDSDGDDSNSKAKAAEEFIVFKQSTKNEPASSFSEQAIALEEMGGDPFFLAEDDD